MEQQAIKKTFPLQNVKKKKKKKKKKNKKFKINKIIRI
jgi:hypothetical protein